MASKILVIQVAALGYDLLMEHGDPSLLGGLSYRAVDSIFPAVTCSVQASFRTGELPASHGVVGNGHWVKELRKPLFWEQSSALVEGPRIWQPFRDNGGRVGLYFWQQSLGESVDQLLSPAPIHKHGGGLVDAVYSKPSTLYKDLSDSVGRRFRLRHYWGPLASGAASDWIAAATAAALASPDAPDLILTYLPHLDYDLQRYGPRTKKASRALIKTLELVRQLVETAHGQGYETLIFGDYAIAEARNVLYPNRLLRIAGLMATRSVKGMAYPDFHESRAFAVVDHEVAHVYLRDPNDLEETMQCFANVEDIEILAGDSLAAAGVDHERSGELVLIGKNGAWFAYPWWINPREETDYTGHVDIHNKPGYDPCELFFGWPPFRVSTDPTRIKGTHGRVGPDRRVAVACTAGLPESCQNLLDVSDYVRTKLDGTC